MKTRYKILVIFVLGIAAISSAFGSIYLLPGPYNENYTINFQGNTEYYAVEITGLKDTYLVGEQYDFSYIISGFGYQCGSKKVSFPDENGEITKIISSSSCIAGVPMEEFIFDIQKEHGTTFGHIALNNPGTYTVNVTFDRPNQYFPTITVKEFRVIENNNDLGQLKGIFGNCACQERVKTNPDTIERCPQPFIDWQNSTHYIDNNICEWQLISGQSDTGSYELETPLCMGGRGYIVNDECERIGKYDPATGLPIVENKVQCDLLDGDWNEQQNICDSKYG